MNKLGGKYGHIRRSKSTSKSFRRHWHSVLEMNSEETNNVVSTSPIRERATLAAKYEEMNSVYMVAKSSQKINLNQLIFGEIIPPCTAKLSFFLSTVKDKFFICLRLLYHIDYTQIHFCSEKISTIHSIFILVL